MNDATVQSEHRAQGIAAALAAATISDTALARSMDDMATREQSQDPFCSSASWQQVWHETRGPERPLIVRRSRHGLLCFAEDGATTRNHTLVPLENGWHFGSNLLGTDGVDLLGELVDELAGLPHAFPNIVISAQDPNGPISKRLFSLFRNDFDFYRCSKNIQCAASLTDGLDGYMGRRSAHHRKKLRQQSRKASKTGICFERHAPMTEAKAEQVFARMFQVELASWKGINRCGMESEPSRSYYLRMLISMARSARARVIFARHGDEDIGYIFGGLLGTIYRGQQFSFDARWHKHSVGNLLQYEQVKWLCEEGMERYDMGPLQGKRMDYKHHWTEAHYPIITWVMVRKRRPATQATSAR